MSESIITDVYAGKFVLMQLVDTTIELTVENNIYSLSEALELEQDLENALYTLKRDRDHILKEGSTYSQEIKDLLEHIDE